MRGKSHVLGLSAMAIIVIALAGCELLGLSEPIAQIRTSTSDMVVGVAVLINAYSSEGEGLAYQWSLDQRPSGSAAMLSSYDRPETSLIPDVPGEYAVRLTVRNAGGTDNETYTFTARAGNAVATPTITPVSGTYTSAQTVTLYTSTSGASIRYTTDNSIPSSTHGIIYMVPVTVSASCTIMAVACRSGMTTSAVASATYTITSSTGGTGVTVDPPWDATITFSGNQSTLAAGSSMTVTATVTPTPDSYQWYLDGEPITGATSSTLAVNAPVLGGSHVVTLIVKKGTALASEQFSFTVASAAAGTISGTVADAYSGSSIPGVAVTVSSGSATIASAITDGSGAYSVSAAAGTGYTVTFTKSGYIAATYFGVSVVGSVTLYLESVLYVSDTYSGTGSVSGTITDAFAGSGVSGAGIALFAGINTTSGTIVATTTTDSYGSYSFSFIAGGYYTAQVSKSGYTTASFTVVVLGGLTRANQNSSITPNVTSSQIRIVLTWGASPSDLDSHLKVPLGSSSDHVYYSDHGSDTSSPFAQLDLDDTSSYGPETITIYAQQPGDYWYYVHDYTNKGATTSTALASSGAVVKVYMGASLAAQYNVPGSGGTLWKVFKLNGTTITPDNSMLYEASSGNVTSRGISSADGLDTGEQAFFATLPRKW